MVLISLMIVLALEIHFKIGSEFRRFEWLLKVRNFYSEQFGDKGFFDSWFGIAIVLLTPVLVLFGVSRLFDGALYWLVMFVLSVGLLFFSLGPKPLEKAFEKYFESMERGDAEAAFLHLEDAEESGENITTPEDDELVRNATRKILVESQKRYFGVIAWFLLLGPFAALFYRLAFVYRDHCAKEEFDEHLPLMEQLIHWIDWIPARITCMMFLLTGDFANGFYRVKDYLTDADADNRQLISETGVAALGLDMGVSEGDVEENHQTMNLVQRTAIFYLVLAAFVSMIS